MVFSTVRCEVRLTDQLLIWHSLFEVNHISYLTTDYNLIWEKIFRSCHFYTLRCEVCLTDQLLIWHSLFEVNFTSYFTPDKNLIRQKIFWSCHFIQTYGGIYCEMWSSSNKPTAYLTFLNWSQSYFISYTRLEVDLTEELLILPFYINLWLCILHHILHILSFR